MDKIQSAIHRQDLGDMQEFQELLSKVEKDIEFYYEYTNNKRKKYKLYVQCVNVIVSILYPLTALSVALSFLKNLQILMNVFSLLFSAIGTIVLLVSKGLAWNEKLQQRTVTYLKLDELMRDMRYERSLNEDNLNRYVERYKMIISEDNKAGLGNVMIMGKHSKNVTNESEIK